MSISQVETFIRNAGEQYAQQDILKDGPQGLDKIQPGLYTLWSIFGDVPDFLHIPIVPFQFNVVAAATSLMAASFRSST